MKAVTLLVNSFLPEDLRDEKRVYDKKGLDATLAEVAKRYPDQYADIVQKISDVGRHAAYRQGATLRLQDMKPVFDKDDMLAQMDKDILTANRSIKDPEAQKATKLRIWSDYAERMERMTVDSALATGNNLGNTVVSGARGSPFQLKAMVTTPALYTDYKDRAIPLFVRTSFGEGLRPAAYLASSFGARRSVISTKNSTAKGGDYGKQMAQAAATVSVTEDDCGASNGLDYDTDSNDLEGRLLGHSVGPIDAGTVIDKQVLSQMRARGVKKVIARSPLTCQAKRGICSSCLGMLPEGRMAPKGYQAGITAAQGLSEPVVQSSLNSKHSGGGFSGKRKQFSGFEVINQLVQSPETFPNKATVAELDGRIDSIEDAPQGGKFIKIGDQQHYVLPGFEVDVKPGDRVEAGEQLSEGVVDVADILRLRGLGEARRYYVDRLKQAYQESGVGNPARINLELVARAALDHVRIDDPDGLDDYLPDDIASYSKISSRYSPPKDTRFAKTGDAVGQYLQAPALHYTIGTKLTPKMTQRLQENGFGNVSVSAAEPKFVPDMVRLRAATHDNPDWMVRLNTSYLTSNIADAAHRALDTNTNQNEHFAPRLAIGKDFGKNIESTGKF